jgi:hypothetical protein
MGNETSLCCNNAYVNKNHEVLSPDFQHHRGGLKMPEQHRRGKATRRKEDKENKGDGYEEEEDVGYGGGPPGEM